jgi:hypothetical protein
MTEAMALADRLKKRVTWELSIDDKVLILTALRSTPTPAPAVTVPAGWRLVPERATDAQMNAGIYQSSADATSADVYSIYADMIDAAPSIDDHPSKAIPVSISRKPAPAVSGDTTGDTFRFFSQNVDAWGALEWFDRLAKAVRQQNSAVVAGNLLEMETCRNIAASSAMRLVRDYEREVRAALQQAPETDAVTASETR